MKEERSINSLYQIFNPLNSQLNPICHLLALLGAHDIFHVSGLRVNWMALCHSDVNYMLSTDINITETTYSCHFQYEFGNQYVEPQEDHTFLWPLSP